MLLLKFRIIGHPDFESVSWIEVGEGINILAPETTNQAQTLLHVLQAIHPPYDCQQVQPFETFPQYRNSNFVTRKVILSKRTAVIAIYSASTALVEKLAAIDPLYWEVDRIEIGRRRDYSQWISFVEIPASARWSQVAKILQPLLASLPAEIAKKFDVLSQTMSSWSGTDRLKGERADWLRAQIRRLQALLPQQQRLQLDHCLQSLALDEHFHQAKKLVMTNLPLFLDLPCGNIPLPIQERLEFLTTRLVEGVSDKAALNTHIKTINRKLRALGVSVTLVPEQNSLQMHYESTSRTHEMGGDDATDEAMRWLQCAGVLHRTVYGTDPIFLVDFKRYCERRIRCEDPIAQVWRLCGRFQCLIAPDEHLHTLCRQSGRTHLLHSDQMRIITI